MKVREVLTSITFRYIARYIMSLSATVFVLLGAIYGYFTYTYFSDLSISIVEELDTIEVVYRGQSMSGVGQYIDDQLSGRSVEPFYYLITNADGEKVAGNLPARPSYREFSGGWMGFQLDLLEWGEPGHTEFLARPIQLDDGFTALVAQNYADAVEKAGLVFRTLIRAMVVTLILGLAGGYISASSTLDRIERLKIELSTVIRGGPGQRLQVGRELGNVRELAVMMNDILDQMETLMQGVRRVSDNIAHDLRTPLTRIRNHLSQLQSGIAKAGKDDVQDIIEECDELLLSFNALLRISTLETGNALAGGSEIELQNLLRDVVELYEPVAEEKGVTLQLQSDCKHYCIGEVDLLFQLFTNLVDNAVKYTPSGGTVDVSLFNQSAQGEDVDMTNIIIADSGPGVATAERKNVFRRFYRVESSRGEQPGHGLGLSLVQAIAQYHHGRVELGSNNPGLQVRVKFPVSRPS
jgi:signal transduction histidine kinase